MVAQVWCHYAQVRREKYISKQVQVCFVCAWCQSKCVICVGSPAGVCVVPVKVCYVLVAPPGCAWCQSSVLCVLVAQVWCQYAQVRHENILLSKSSCVIYMVAQVWCHYAQVRHSTVITYIVFYISISHAKQWTTLLSTT